MPQPDQHLEPILEPIPKTLVDEQGLLVAELFEVQSAGDGHVEQIEGANLHSSILDAGLIVLERALLVAAIPILADAYPHELQPIQIVFLLDEGEQQLLSVEEVPLQEGPLRYTQALLEFGELLLLGSFSLGLPHDYILSY